MPLNSTLPLNTGVRAAVYRWLCDRFEADPDLKRVIDPDGWYVYDERHPHAEDFGQALATAARLTPVPDQAASLTNVQQYSALSLKLEICTPGPHAEDLLNLWEAFESVLFLGDGGRAVISALTAAAQGCRRPGQVVGLRLSVPAVTPNPPEYAGGLLYAAGLVTVEMTVRK